MSITSNIGGTTSNSFKIGENGPTLYHGTSTDNITPTQGDIFIDTSGTPEIKQFVSNGWKSTGSSPLIDEFNKLTVSGNKVFGTDASGNVTLLDQAALLKLLDISNDPVPTIITAQWSEATIPSDIKRPDGRTPIYGDVLLNTTSGDYFVRQEDGTWKTTGSIKGKDGSTTIVSYDNSGEQDTVRFFVSKHWDGGSGHQETVAWPGGYIFKDIPVADFRGYIVGDTTPVWDAAAVPNTDSYRSAITNQTTTGFDYKHIGIWPGFSKERLSFSVQGTPDYDAMKANGWTPPTKMVNNVPLATSYEVAGISGKARDMCMIISGTPSSIDSNGNVHVTFPLQFAPGTVPNVQLTINREQDGAVVRGVSLANNADGTTTVTNTGFSFIPWYVMPNYTGQTGRNWTVHIRAIGEAE